MSVLVRFSSGSGQCWWIILDIAVSKACVYPLLSGHWNCLEVSMIIAKVEILML